MSPSTQIYQELKNSYTPATVTNNIKENVNTLYNGHNIVKKQLKPLQPSLGQSEN